MHLDWHRTQAPLVDEGGRACPRRGGTKMPRRPRRAIPVIRSLGTSGRRPDPAYTWIAVSWCGSLGVWSQRVMTLF